MNSVFKITSVLTDPNTGNIRVAEFALRHTDEQFPGTEILQAGIVPLSKHLAANASDATIIADLVAQGVCQSPENAQFVFEQMAFRHAINTMQKVSRLPPEPPPVPESISDRQFFHVLAKRGLITQDEALQAVKTGDLPAALEAYVASMPDDQEFDVRMLLEGGTEFRRDHPLTAAFGAFFGMIPAQIDELFIEGAQI